MDNDPNPQVTKLLRVLTGIEAWVVLFSGLGLLFLPQLVGPLWPWEIAPFNTRFMGALYLTTFTAAGIMTWKARWSPARVVLPMIFIFTIIILFVSIIYFENFTRPFSTIIWFALYIIIPINALYHLWLYRELHPSDSLPTPPLLRAIAFSEVVLFGFYGIALLLVPAHAGKFWPWVIDDFHGRMYCVAFITPAVGTWLIRNSASVLEYFTLAIAHIFGGVFPIFGLLIVDLSVKRVDWISDGTWLWIAIGLVSAGIGIVMLLHARRISMEKVRT